MQFFFIDDYPKLNGRPRIHVDLINNKMRVSCSFDPADKSDRVRHVVTFHEGHDLVEGVYGKLIFNKTLTGQETSTFIENEEHDGQQYFKLPNEVRILIFYLLEIQSFLSISKARKYIC